MNTQCEWISCESDVALAQMVADRWLRQARAQRQCVALSGGRIARRLFEAVTAQADGREGCLQQIEFFWADERCVPPDDPESNFRLAMAHLLDPLHVQPERIHRLQGERNPDEAAQSGEQELRQHAATQLDGQPVLDLVFLGMGEDGHVASLFPDAPQEVLRSKATYLGVIGPKPPPRRITLSYAALTVARQVWVLASGPGKEAALRASLEGEALTPLGRLLRLRSNTLVFSELKIGNGGTDPCCQGSNLRSSDESHA